MKSDVRDVGDNRVDVTSPSRKASLHAYAPSTLVGNHTFSESDLQDIFKLKVSDFWTYWEAR